MSTAVAELPVSLMDIAHEANRRHPGDIAAAKRYFKREVQKHLDELADEMLAMVATRAIGEVRHKVRQSVKQTSSPYWRTDDSQAAGARARTSILDLQWKGKSLREYTGTELIVQAAECFNKARGWERMGRLLDTIGRIAGTRLAGRAVSESRAEAIQWEVFGSEQATLPEAA